jgi:hypothetical protein
VAFTRLTTDLAVPGAAPPMPSAAARLVANRPAVMAAVRESFKGVIASAGAEDRVRLEQHAARIDELEKSLTVRPAAAPPGRGCSPQSPALPATFKATDKTQQNLGSRAQIANAVLALACNLTRVATIQYTEYDSPTFDWLNLGLSGGWHARVHAHGGDDPEGMARAFAWYGEECAALLGALDAVDEGGSTLLDNTLVLWLSEFGDGGAHDTRNLPVVLGGGLGGRLKTGRHVAFGNRSHNDLFTTILNLFGFDDKQFGMPGPDFNQGPLPIT